MDRSDRGDGCLVRRHDFIVLPGSFGCVWELAVMAVDDLRTKIAAVMLAHSESDDGPDCTCGWEWQGDGLWKDCYADHLAGAVIAELQPELTRHDTGCVCDECWFNR